MKIRFSRHANDRLKQRSISREQVKEALLNGQSRHYQEHGTIECIYKKFGKKLIVVYFQFKDLYKIVTAYYED